MAYGSAIRQGLRIAGRIDQKYNLNKIFIDKYFPPGYRPGAKKLVDLAGVFGGGYGIYQLIQSFYAPTLSTGNGLQTPIPRNGSKFHKTRRAGTRRNTLRRCRPNFRSNRYRRYSN